MPGQFPDLGDAEGDPFLVRSDFGVRYRSRCPQGVRGERPQLGPAVVISVAVPVCTKASTRQIRPQICPHDEVSLAFI